MGILSPFPKDSVPLEPPSTSFQTWKSHIQGEEGIWLWAKREALSIIPDLRERGGTPAAPTPRDTARLPAAPTGTRSFSPSSDLRPSRAQPEAEPTGRPRPGPSSPHCLSLPPPSQQFPCLALLVSNSGGPCFPQGTFGSIWRPFGCLSRGDVMGVQG